MQNKYLKLVSELSTSNNEKFYGGAPGGGKSSFNEDYLRLIGITFENFYELYPRKEGRKSALLKWERLSPAQRKKAMDTLPDHIQAWAGRERQFIPLPATWLFQERFEDVLTSELPQKQSCGWGGCAGNSTKTFGTQNVCETHFTALMRGETPGRR